MGNEQSQYERMDVPADPADVALGELHDCKLSSDSLDKVSFRDIVREKKNVHFNFYTADSLQSALFSCDMVKKLNTFPEMMDLITEYYGLCQWSDQGKMPAITTMESLDKKIHYAIRPKPKTGGGVGYDSVFFDQWIDGSDASNKSDKAAKTEESDESDSENKGIFRYIFKYFTDSNFEVGPTLWIGFVTAGYTYTKEQQLGRLYSGGVVNSVSVALTGRYYWLSTGGKDEREFEIKEPDQGLARWDWNNYKLSGLEENDPNGNSYCLFELNLIEKRIKLYCNVIDKDSRMIQFNIPEQIIDQMKLGPIKIGVTLRTEYKDTGSFGIGIVRDNY